MILNIAVEGASDMEAASAVVRYAGHQVARVINKGGKSNVDRDIPKYIRASASAGWVVFRDSDGRCPVELAETLLPDNYLPTSRFQLRVAHSMTEAWLLADREGFASFFHVSRDRVKRDPENLPVAKREVLNLCSRSRLRTIRESMVTPDGETGPLYVSLIEEFAREKWDVGAAVSASPSLKRAVKRIKAMA